MTSIQVELGERSYPIYIGQNLLAQSELLGNHIKGSALLVSSDNIPAQYINQVRESLAGVKHQVLILPDGEQHKNLTTTNMIYSALLEHQFDRQTTLIALGGGVIGDMVGFAAATYQRGVHFIQIPTTLLAQVDSAVGGKTGVNHPLGKNMIGAFYQPQCVISDFDTLKTLPERHLANGMAEIIKYGMLGDSIFFSWLEDNVVDIMKLSAGALAHAIKQSCRNKAHIVAADEYESGKRALLNLGHTFGHAIETAQGYGNWLHGEAVAAGMVMAARVSRQCGLISKTDYKRCRDLIAKAKLPISPPEDMSCDDFLTHMQRDKKNSDNNIRLVLLAAIGRAMLSADYSQAVLKKCLKHKYSRNPNAFV